MKKIMPLVFALTTLNMSVFSMNSPLEAEEKSVKVNNCEVCGKVAKSKCAQCNEAHYCCREHQREHWWKSHKILCKPKLKKLEIPDWASLELKKHIEYCIKYPDSTVDGSINGSINGVILVVARGLNKEVIEVLQVVLNKKPLAYNIEEPSAELMEVMLKYRSKMFIEDLTKNSLWNEALRFAKENGVKTANYFESEYNSKVLIAYKKEEQKSAQFFIDRRENPKRSGEDIEGTILNGLLLKYELGNIRDYCYIQYDLNNRFGQQAQSYFMKFYQAAADKIKDL